MAVTVTSRPSEAEIGSVVGAPLRLPCVLLCTQGERFCGAAWTANTAHELAERMAERRAHETGCLGGLILPGT